MPNKFFLPFLVVVVVIILIILIVVIIKKMGSNEEVVVKKKIKLSDDKEQKRKYTIKDMVEVAARRDSSREDLKKAIDIVAKDLLFPKKEKYKVPEIAKIYLNFVLLIASHRNADAKLIAYMDGALKAANPEYSKEIDIYENEGFRERAKRI